MSATAKTILDKFYELCATPSDINEHLTKLMTTAQKCSHVTEMGVRGVVSTYAFLAAKPEQVVGYDIARWEQVDECERLAKEAGVNWKFHLANVLEVDIDPTEFLFIDTYHSAEQLRRELARHAGKVSKYIGFHDIFTFGINAEPPYEGISPEVNCGKGLLFAIDEFLSAHPEWKIIYKTSNNNGLMIIGKDGNK